MRGFARRTLVETALAWVDAQIGPRPHETIDLSEAHGRVLAEPLVAAIDVPPFDRAAMDGYAIRGGETEGAGDYNPLAFRLMGESLPGRPFAGEVPPHSAVRIMTGAPVPRGCDAVVPAEYATESGGSVEVTIAVPPGKHVGRRGEDVHEGTQVLSSRRRLRPQDVGLLASVGVGSVTVISRPRVRIVITGNELVSPGEVRGPSQIFDSNSGMLRALIERDGGRLESLRRVDDERPAIEAAIAEPGADVVLVSGGSSVGAEDFAPSIVAAAGELSIHGIAMRPSSPTGMGRIGSALIFLLPGNPVSCLCAYDFFAGRAVRLLGGRSADWPYVARTVPLARKIVSSVGRVDYCRVALTERQAEPIAVSGASILSSTTRADGFVIIPSAREGYPAGTEVSVYLYEPID